MNILALDLGTKCGYADKYSSGVWNLKPSVHETAGLRNVKLYAHLTNRIKTYGIDLVVYEEVHAHIGVEAAHVYGNLMGITQLVCLQQKIEYRGVGVQAIKKHATGKGNAKKEDMIVAATLEFKSVNIIDDNHADALWLYDYAMKNFNT